jgi:hypothetical protein
MSRFRYIVFVFFILVVGIQNLNAQKVSVEDAREQYFAMDKSGAGALKLYKTL